MQRLLLFYLTLCLCSNGLAQRTSLKDKHYIDISMGGNIPLFSINGDDLGKRLLNGNEFFTGSLSLRYQYFFNMKWGAFIDVQLTSNTISGYDELPGDVQPDKEHFYVLGGNENPNPDILRYTYLAGGIYRVDKCKWSFRPYLGIGLGYVRMNPISFKLKGKGNNEILENNLQLNDGKSYNYNMCLSPGIYVAWKFTSDIHFFADLNYIQHLQSVRYTYKETDRYTGKLLKEIKYSSGINSYANVNIGISIPLWYNRRM